MISYSRKRKSSFELLAFFGVPIAFLVIIYLIAYIVGNPIIVPLQAIASMVVQEDSPNFAAGTENEYLTGLVTKPGAEHIKASGITLPKYGEKYAHISIEGTDVNCDVALGDSNEILRYSAGQYLGSSYPGFGGSILMAAHKTTHFMDLKSVQIGSVITVSTTWGLYTYTVEDIRILNPADYRQMYDPDATEENLVLYTCYPFNMLGFSKQRYFVKAAYTSGPIVDIYE
jgi:sortase A